MHELANPKWIGVRQRTEEWHLARQGKITGTRAATILCGSAKEVMDLRDEMAREISGESGADIIPDNADMRRGRGAESPIFTKFYEDRGINGYTLGGKFSRYEFAQHPCGWMACSPDAFYHGDTLVEIKAPRKIVDVDDRPRWEAQTLYNACITNATEAFLIQGEVEEVFPDGDKPDDDFPDGEWSVNQLSVRQYGRNQIVAFWEDSVPVLTAFWEALSESLYSDGPEVDPDVLEAAAEWSRLSDEIETLRLEQGERRQRLVAAAEPTGCMDIGGLRVSKTREGAPTIDYKAACAKLLPNADLSEFEKPGRAASWRVVKV